MQLSVLKSLDQATAFLGHLNRLLIALGLVAVVVGSCMVFIFSHTLTRPLGTLVEGVRALGKGDYEYPLAARGSDEVAEVTASFVRMRAGLQETQRKLIESERLATIGRMASSISHDLRHSLAAVMANAEFLSDNNRSKAEREELYHEVLAGRAPDDRSDRLAAGVFADPRVVAPHLRRSGRGGAAIDSERARAIRNIIPCV